MSTFKPRFIAVTPFWNKFLASGETIEELKKDLWDTFIYTNQDSRTYEEWLAGVHPNIYEFKDFL